MNTHKTSINYTKGKYLLKKPGTQHNWTLFWSPWKQNNARDFVTVCHTVTLSPVCAHTSSRHRWLQPSKPHNRQHTCVTMCPRECQPSKQQGHPAKRQRDGTEHPGTACPSDQDLRDTERKSQRPWCPGGSLGLSHVAHPTSMMMQIQENRYKQTNLVVS